MFPFRPSVGEQRRVSIYCGYHSSRVLSYNWQWRCGLSGTWAAAHLQVRCVTIALNIVSYQQTMSFANEAVLQLRPQNSGGNDTGRATFSFYNMVCIPFLQRWRGHHLRLLCSMPVTGMGAAVSFFMLLENSPMNGATQWISTPTQVQKDLSNQSCHTYLKFP